MLQVVDFLNVEETFRNDFQKVVAQESRLSLDSALEKVVEFYKNYKIHGVDSAEQEDDVLLFQYGVYDFTQEQSNEASFTVDFTRQFRVNDDEEYYQLSLTFSFEKEKFAGIDDYNKWSMDCESIEDWLATIQRTDGFCQAKLESWKSYKIGLSGT